MNRLIRVFVLLSAVLFVGAGVASADTFQFVLTGPVSETFDVLTPLNLVPAAIDTGFGFTLSPNANQVTGLPAGDFVTFYNAAFGGGFAVFADANTIVAYPFGTQIYGGTESNPTFAPGSFTLTDGNAAAGTVPGTYTLTITDLTRVETPEPAVTILLAIGLVGVALIAFRFKPNFGVSAS